MNISRLTVVVFLILFGTNFSMAQIKNSEMGKVELVQEKNVKELLDKHIEINSKAPIKGYRIKIHFGSDKNKAKEVKAKFIAKFPDIAAYEKYDQPNFNIRVGDFRTKLEAYKVLKEVQVEFPSSFLVQDEIEMPKLIGAEIK
jgi:hypothetical protein